MNIFPVDFTVFSDDHCYGSFAAKVILEKKSLKVISATCIAIDKKSDLKLQYVAKYIILLVDGNCTLQKLKYEIHMYDFTTNQSYFSFCSAQLDAYYHIRIKVLAVIFNTYTHVTM